MGDGGRRRIPQVNGRHGSVKMVEVRVDPQNGSMWQFCAGTRTPLSSSSFSFSSFSPSSSPHPPSSCSPPPPPQDMAPRAPYL